METAAVTGAPRLLANNSSRRHLHSGLRVSSPRTHNAWLLHVVSADPRLFCDSRQLQKSHLGAHQTRP